MAKLRIKRGYASATGVQNLLAGEFGLAQSNLFYAPALFANASNDATATPVLVEVATRNNDNLFTGANTFKAASDATKTLLFKDSNGNDFYQVVAGRIQTANSFAFNNADLVNKAYVDTAVAASDALILKGSLNATTGVITSSITAINGKTIANTGATLTNYQVGWTFKVDTAGTITDLGILQVGDLVVAMADYNTVFAIADFKAYQTNVEFSAIGSNLAITPDVTSVSFIRINANESITTRNASEFKTDLSLNNVENTALSTWVGTANITTLGTIGTGTWNATTISIAKGGTGQTTANAGFNALSPMTTSGDIIYGGTSGAATRLGANTTATRMFLRSVSSGIPAWDTVTKTDVGLSLVENTALSTWAGTTSITTVGTIATGTWSATTIAVNKGGTGQTSYTNGQLLIGNTTGNTLTKATLTETTNQTKITNGAGSITLGLADNIVTVGTLQTGGQLTVGTGGGTWSIDGLTANKLQFIHGTQVYELPNNKTAGTYVLATINDVPEGVKTSDVTDVPSTSYYLSFVDSNNASPTIETLYTRSTLSFVPSTGVLTATEFSGLIDGGTNW